MLRRILVEELQGKPYAPVSTIEQISDDFAHRSPNRKPHNMTRVARTNRAILALHLRRRM